MEELYPLLVRVGASVFAGGMIIRTLKTMMNR